MKIVLTGGGSAGHFYPLIAIAEALNKKIEKENLISAKLYYVSTTAYDKKALFENHIEFKRVFAGKARRYFSLFNILDAFKMVFGVFKALWDMFVLFPDVVVSKGGYASVPAVFAAWIFGIPVVIHESDSVPGRTNRLVSRFARRVAVSWPEAAEFFPSEKTAVTGQPVRRELIAPIEHGVYEYLKLDKQIPILFILGGSQGAKIINDSIVDILPDLISRYQIIHQTGQKNLESMKKMASVNLKSHPHKNFYRPFGYLNSFAMRMSAGAATIVISRAGSTIFEIAAWGLPSIIIPITNSNGDHQRRNAFNYSRRGACVVIEEENLSPHLLLSEINRLIDDEVFRKKMGEAAKKFFSPDAADKIAQEVITIALEHEQ